MVGNIQTIKEFALFVFVQLMEVYESHILSYLVFGQQNISVMMTGLAFFFGSIVVRYILTKVEPASKKVSRSDSDRIKRIKLQFTYKLNVKYSVW